MKFKTLDLNCVNGMYNILINNLMSMSNSFAEKDDDYEKWEKYCMDNEVIPLYENKKVYAFLMYKDNQILEIQIDSKHKGDGVTFRTLIKKFLDNIDDYDKVICNLYPYHKKAIEIFTSIGFVKIGKTSYEMNLERFKAWAYRR